MKYLLFSMLNKRILIYVGNMTSSGLLRIILCINYNPY
jgi:hypothetical protein